MHTDRKVRPTRTVPWAVFLAHPDLVPPFLGVERENLSFSGNVKLHEASSLTII
jgi:hypothetical protein